MPYIVSTHTSDVQYMNLKNTAQGGPNIAEKLPTGKDFVLVKGKHGVAQRNKTRGLFTINGIVTQVTEEELEFLHRNQAFQQHQKAGAVKVMKNKPDGEEVSKGMATSPDAPLTSKDYLAGGRLTIPEDLRINGASIQ